MMLFKWYNTIETFRRFRSPSLYIVWSPKVDWWLCLSRNPTRWNVVHVAPFCFFGCCLCGFSSKKGNLAVPRLVKLKMPQQAAWLLLWLVSLNLVIIQAAQMPGGMLRLLLFEFVGLTINAGLITVNTKNNRLIDEDGRERIFHGTNVVYKVGPSGL